MCLLAHHSPKRSSDPGWQACRRAGARAGPDQIDVEARDARGKVLQSLSLDLCVPQFVVIDKDPAFDALLATYGSIAPEIDEVLQVAKDACDRI